MEQINALEHLKFIICLNAHNDHVKRNPLIKQQQFYMKKVLCFGEVLLRFSPDDAGEWLHSNKLAAFIGGAELNVATALARWNIPAKYFTAVPDNYLSQQLIDVISKSNIDISAICYTGDRLGIYYLLQGADLKHTSVIYDRAGSSLATLGTGIINWDEVLNDVSWFHFSAITPALSKTAVALCQEVLEACHQKGIPISVDLNYRSKLWQYGSSPVDIMPELVKYCRVIMGNIWAANTLLDIEVDEAIHTKKSKQAYLDHSDVTAGKIMGEYPNCKAVANTFRFDTGEQGMNYFTSLHTGGKQYLSQQYQTDTIINKVGSGDCFMAGLIYGFIQNHSPQQVIDFATSAAFGKLYEDGDTTNQQIETIQQRINNG